MTKKELIPVNKKELTDIYKNHPLGESKDIYLLSEPLKEIKGYENKAINLPVAFENSYHPHNPYVTDIWSVFTDKFFRGEEIEDTMRKGFETTRYYGEWDELLEKYRKTELEFLGHNYQDHFSPHACINAYEIEGEDERGSAIDNLINKYVTLHKKFEDESFGLLNPNKVTYRNFEIMQHTEEAKDLVDFFNEVEKNVKSCLVAYK